MEYNNIKAYGIWRYCWHIIVFKKLFFDNLLSFIFHIKIQLKYRAKPSKLKKFIYFALCIMHTCKYSNIFI